MNWFRNLLKNKNAKAGGFYLIGNVFNKAIVFLTIPLFTRLMSTSDFGVFNTYMSWVSILSLIVGLSLGSSIRGAYADFRGDLEGFVSSIFFLSFLNFLVASTGIILLSNYFIKQLDIILVILCLVQSYMTFVLTTIDIKYMMDLDYIKKTMLLAIPNVVVAILSVIFLMNINDDKYLGRIIPYVLVTTVVGSCYLAITFIKGKKFIIIQYWKYAMVLSIPLIFHGLSINILSTSDRTMITVFRSASESGIYSLVYNLGMIASVVTTSMESVWIPWFTRKLQKNEKSVINKNVKIYIEIVVVVVIVILLISPEFLVIMAPKEYWGGKTLIPPVLLASFFIFLYSISVNLEYYYKSTKIIATNTLIAASLNLGLNLILIPLYGAIAAAFSTVLAYVVSFGIHYYAARKLDNELFPFNVYLKPILLVCIAVAISYLIIDLAIARWTIALVGFGLYTIISFKKGKFSALLK